MEQSNNDILRLLNYLSDRRMDILEKTEKVEKDSIGEQLSTLLVGNKHGQITKKEIDDFFSPVSGAVLEEFDNDTISGIQIFNGYLLIITNDAIFKFTHNKDIITVNALKRPNHEYFYFAKSASKNCNEAIKRTVIKLKNQY